VIYLQCNCFGTNWY